MQAAYGGPPVREIKKSNLHFMQMVIAIDFLIADFWSQKENIGYFLEACQKMGLRASDCFMTVDLYEGKNLLAVRNPLCLWKSF